MRSHMVQYWTIKRRSLQASQNGRLSSSSSGTGRGIALPLDGYVFAKVSAAGRRRTGGGRRAEDATSREQITAPMLLYFGLPKKGTLSTWHALAIAAREPEDGRAHGKVQPLPWRLRIEMTNETPSRPPSSSSSAALEVRDLVKTFGGRRVVNGASFELQRGEAFGFLGPNGSGKTTTMRMTLDLIRPDFGSVLLLGGVPHRRAMRRVAYLSEERGLFQRARVIDALRYLGRLKGLEAKAAER